MSADAAELQRRREMLIAQCDAQRADVARYVGGLATPVRIADRVANVLHYLRRHPLAAGASAVTLLVTQRRGLLKWGQRAFVAWRAWRAWRGRRDAI